MKDRKKNKLDCSGLNHAEESVKGDCVMFTHHLTEEPVLD